MSTQTDIKESQRKVKPLTPKVKELISASKSVILGTLDANGIPNSSYAPFVQVGNSFYILVSFMARHTKNLRDIKKVSAMFIEDESATKQIYARERLTIDAVTSQVERDSALWDEIIENLKQRHGKILDILAPMEDFILIALHPVKGSYVNGFGSAYFVDENLEILQHRNDIAHGIKQD